MIGKIQEALKRFQIDGWLFYDFQGRNSCFVKLFLQGDEHLTRRVFYWIPKQGKPVKIVHRIESHLYRSLEGEERCYIGWKDLQDHLQQLFQNVHTICMEYSENAYVPTVSFVDGGTLEWIRSFGVTVTSSGDLIQELLCVLDKIQLQSHYEASNVNQQAIQRAWQAISQSFTKNEPITEYEVQQILLQTFKEHRCIPEGNPICAVNANAADPHFEPSKVSATPIQEGDLILIDLWCKQDVPRSIFSDITKIAVAAKRPTPKQEKIFSIVKKARDAAFSWIEQKLKQKQLPKGYEVDQICRSIIEKEGYGPYFIHRTGHNIFDTTHGPGANLDSLETKDTRALLPGTCFSIEPGIYLPGEMGIRLENDLIIHENFSLEITGGIQDTIPCLLG